MASITLRPTHLMDGQLFISQKLQLISLTLKLCLKILVLKFALIFKHLLERVAQLYLTIATASCQLRRNVHNFGTAKCCLIIRRRSKQALSHWL